MYLQVVSIYLFIFFTVAPYLLQCDCVSHDLSSVRHHQTFSGNEMAQDHRLAPASISARCKLIGPLKNFTEPWKCLVKSAAQMTFDLINQFLAIFQIYNNHRELTELIKSYSPTAPCWPVSLSPLPALCLGLTWGLSPSRDQREPAESAAPVENSSVSVSWRLRAMYWQLR